MDLDREITSIWLFSYFDRMEECLKIEYNIADFAVVCCCRDRICVTFCIGKSDVYMKYRMCYDCSFLNRLNTEICCKLVYLLDLFGVNF